MNIRDFIAQAKKESPLAIKTICMLVCKFKNLRITRKLKIHKIKVTRKFSNLQYFNGFLYSNISLTEHIILSIKEEPNIVF